MALILNLALFCGVATGETHFLQIAPPFLKGAQVHIHSECHDRASWTETFTRAEHK